MKKFAISLSQRSTEKFEPRFHEEIEGDDLLELLAKFILTIARLHKRLLDEEYEKRKEDDDIPF